MTAEEAYVRFLYLAEQTGSMRNVSVSRGAFSLLYNRQKNVVVKFHINNRLDEIEEDIESILVGNKLIDDLTLHTPTNSYMGELPEDFLSDSHLFVLARNGDCVDSCTTVKIRDNDRSYYMTNENYKPSFAWRELLYDIKDSKINVYVDDGTEVTEFHFTYYKYPTPIELVDRNNPESQFTAIDLGLGELITDRIISSCVSTFKGSNDDITGYQISAQETVENIK